MNSIEKIVYNVLKSNPRVKYFVRNIYQSVFDMLPSKADFFSSELITAEGYFFGFHDCSPFSSDDKCILAHKLNIPLRMPVKDDLLTVGYFDDKLKVYTKIGDSQAWNYHKGCRLQWLDASSKTIIYNSLDNDHLCSVVYDCNNNSQRIVDFPIDSTNAKGALAISFNYERLEELMPGYGYVMSEGGMPIDFAPKDCGISIVDIINNTSSLIVSLRDLAKLDPDATMQDARHFVTHTEFSPDGRKIAFLHRWVGNDIEKRFSRLVTANIDGTDIKISPTSGMVSHYVWSADFGILAYCQVNGLDGHYLFDDFTMKNYRLLNGDTLDSDGHQHFIPNSSSFVTDTYPDKWRQAKIYHVNIETKEVNKIIDVSSPKKFQSPNSKTHWACDLHPRINNSGSQICFDSVHTGTRSLCIMKLKK